MSLFLMNFVSIYLLWNNVFSAFVYGQNFVLMYTSCMSVVHSFLIHAHMLLGWDHPSACPSEAVNFSELHVSL